MSKTLACCRNEKKEPIDETSYGGGTFRRRLGDVLVDSGYISDEEKEKALAQQKNVGHRHLGEILVHMGLVDEVDVARVLAAQLKLRFVRLDEITTAYPLSDACDLIKPQLALRARCIPIYADDEKIVLAMANPLDLIAIEDVELASNRRVEPVVATPSDILEGLARLYSAPGTQPSDVGDLPDPPDETVKPWLPKPVVKNVPGSRLGDILVDAGFISNEQRRLALAQKERAGRGHLGETLVEMGFVDEETIARVWASQLGIPFVRLCGPDAVSIYPPIIDMVDPWLATRHRCVPISASDSRLDLAMANPFDLIAIEDIRLATDRQVYPVASTVSDIGAALTKFYGTSHTSPRQMASEPPHPLASHTGNEHAENGAPEGWNDQSDENGESHETGTS